MSVSRTEDGHLRQTIRPTELEIEIPNKKLDLGISGVMSQLIEPTGKVWAMEPCSLSVAEKSSNHVLSDTDVKQFLSEFCNPNIQIERCALSAVNFPDNRVYMNEPIGPQSYDEMLDSLSDCKIAALRGGLLPAPAKVADTYRHASGSELAAIREKHKSEWRESLASASVSFTSTIHVAGSAVDAGHEFILITGDRSLNAGAGAERTSGWMLVDPYTGLIYKSSFEIREDGASPILSKVFADIPKSVPANVTVAELRPVLEVGGEGTVVGIYRRAIRATYDVVSGERMETGFAIAPTLLLTAAHVVGSAKTVAIVSVEGRKSNGRVVHVDPVKDLALVELKGVTAPVSLPLSNDLPITGSQVIVIGAPAGLSGTLTTGVVSSTRMVHGISLVQIDALINAGNSGGPILNLRGEVIGIVSFEVVPTDVFKGLGFGIASVDARLGSAQEAASS